MVQQVAVSMVTSVIQHATRIKFPSLMCHQVTLNWGHMTTDSDECGIRTCDKLFGRLKATLNHWNPLPQVPVES
jgi:hypothetical protein